MSGVRTSSPRLWGLEFGIRIIPCLIGLGFAVALKFPALPIGLVSVYLAWTVFHWALVSRASPQVIHTVRLVQFLLDLGGINYFVVVTGSVTTIFVMFYPLFVIVTSLSWGRREGLVSATVATACYWGILAANAVGGFPYGGGVDGGGQEVLKSLLEKNSVWSQASPAYLWVSAAIVVALANSLAWLFCAKLIAARETAESALLDSVRRHEALSAASLEGIVFLHRERILEANEAFGRMFGGDPLLARGSSIYSLLAPESREPLQDVIEGRNDISREGKGIRGNTTLFDIQVTGRAFEYGGEPIRVLSVRDISEQKRLQAQFLQSQKMEAVGQLAGGIAHDFNNLMTVIKTSAQMLQEKVGGRLEELQDVLESTDQAADLTRQLLAFGRRQMTSPESVDASDLVRRTAKMLRRTLGESIQVEVALSSDPCVVQADPVQLTQVLLNLGVNARDAMPGGGRLYLETSRVRRSGNGNGSGAEPAGDCVRIRMRDTGMGMGEDVLAHLFEPFFTTKEVGKGTGLGLSTAYGIVAEHGGSIECDSTPGKGATFTITLPLFHAEAADPVRNASPMRPDASAAALGPRRTILLAEDDPRVLRVARKVLEFAGFHVLSACGMREGLEEAAAYDLPIDLLVTDLVMPDGSGAALAEELAKIHPETKVLYTSGYTDDQTARAGISRGEVPFLGKPFSDSELLWKIQKALA